MIKKIFVSLFCIFFLPNLVLAATSDFTIKTIVGGDTVPPTTPTLLSATPIASDQIDITWSASTDNFLLSGYVLLRDGSPLATTTLTSFSDTGLTAETLYSYEVYAFDSSFNNSTTSNSLATTTLPIVIPPPAPTTIPSSGSAQATRIDSLGDFNIITTVDTATINWDTNRPTRYVLRWGRDDNYSDGYIVNEIFRESHETTVTDLEPGTVYLYELISITPGGISRPLQTGQFKTKEAKVTVSPPNVQRLEAIVEGDDVRLSWQLPAGVSNAKVRVVRSYLGYPSSLHDGAVVYEGGEVSILDEGALNEIERQYYSVFVIDENGNVSSGAVVSAQKRIQEVTFENDNSLPIFVTDDTPRSSTSLPNVTSEEDYYEAEDDLITDFGFDNSNITLVQAGRPFTFVDKDISLSQSEPFIISIPYNSLPKHLKSIVVTLLDPTNHKRNYSFLLRINKDRTAYEATIAPLNVSGISRLQIEIFDFERKIVGLYRKQITFTPTTAVTKDVVFPDKIVHTASNLVPIMVFLAFLFVLFVFFWWRRSQKAEDKR